MIYIGSDHGGFEIKQQVLEYLSKKGVATKNCGTYTCDSCDYPVVAREVCDDLLAGNDGDLAILICGTGIGMSISANKIKGIRAAVCGDTYSSRMAREHNNANVLCIGARVVGVELIMEIVDAFLGAKFAGGRHSTRVDMYE